MIRLNLKKADDIYHLKRIVNDYLSDHPKAFDVQILHLPSNNYLEYFVAIIKEKVDEQ